ncbi:PRC-barrel domain containing protein [Streptomyces sp. NPDC002667]|uniref:PRC-barrel domain containing protein n=1 Tax=Streptomyces sp. NPDC002667 TaxID=3364657 RepID=UPI00367C42AC
MNEHLWGYGPTSGHTPDADLSGYRVEASDGHIGKVGKHSDEVGSQYIVVDTGVWIFGRQVLLPAGTITAISHEDSTIRVGLTKDEIKAAPDFDEEKHLGDPRYRDQLGGHYGSGH